MADELDRRFMAAAIRLGAGANGTTSPNPAVGAILVNDGVVVSRGRTARGGRPHAEAEALAMAGEAARGATLYSSLEPCVHRGRASPCADAIIAAGVSRVVAAVEDPDPRTKGAGFSRLREAGIEVQPGVLSDEARRAHAGHFRRVRVLPHITLKLAVSADDAIGRIGEPQVGVTGEIARRHAQALRTRFDAILVGRGTVEADDPALTVRLPGLERRSPVRIVLDTWARLPPDRRVFTEGNAPTWVMSAANEGVMGEANGEPADRVRRFTAPRSTEGGLDPWSCLYRLVDGGLTRLLVEGGAEIARRFLESDLVDEVLLIRSPKALGGNIVPALAGLPLSTIEA
jgi:diaminohydroxyphosphoribosylaminopyrimidine deaminase/5-amino-6-(5-phosphoribosylamino)uracil reductase